MRLHASLLVVLLVAGCGHFGVRAASESFEPTQYAPGRLAFEGALPVAQVQGSPTEIGAQLGSLAAEPTADLLASFQFASSFLHFRSRVIFKSRRPDSCRTKL